MAQVEGEVSRKGGERSSHADSKTLNKWSNCPNRIAPHRIKHYPSVTLDVVLLSSDQDTPTAAGRHKNTTAAEREEEMVDMSTSDNRTSTLSRTYVLAPGSTFPDPKSRSRTSLSFKQIMKLAQKGSIESSLEEQVVSSLPPDIQVRVRGSTNRRESLIQAIKNGQVDRLSEQLVVCLEELDNKMMDINELASRIMDLVFKNNEQSFEIMDLVSKNSELLIRVNEMHRILDSRQDEMKQLQIQALDQLALLQNNVRALLTQTYEWHEHPIPRLFIVLPADSCSWNPSDFFSNKFRLYFLCECDHTKSTNSKIPHHIHLAKHEGYDIDRPNEFFQQYGSYVLTILRMLKFGISVVGIAVPALSHLIRVDALDQASESLKLLKNTIESEVNQVIDHIEKVSADEGGALAGLAGQMGSNEAWKGADIRQLDTFLQNRDEKRVLGNLYRTLAGEGYVKWVCIDHYRENYNEKAAEAFRNTVETLGGSFDESIGRVELTLFSRMQAEQFYSALEKAKSVYELKVELDWESSQSDFKKLRNTLAISNVGVLELYLEQQDVSTKDIENHGQRYDPVLDIMRHPSIKSFTIRGPQDFSKQSSLLSRNDDCPNLRHLDISFLQLKEDIPGIKCLITKASNLSSLVVGTGTLGTDNDRLRQVYNAVAEHQTYHINFKDWGLSISPPLRESNQSMEWVEHLFKFYCRGTTQKLEVDKLDELTMDALAKATNNGSGFKEIVLERDDR